MKVRKLITQLGGVPAVAKELTEMVGKPVSPGTVYRWRDRETISYRWRPFVAHLMTRRGLKIPAEMAPYSSSSVREGR